MLSAGIGMTGETDFTIDQTVIQNITTAIIFSGNSKKFKNRYLLFENQPSNINGYTILFNSKISKISVKVFLISTGTISILKNNTLLDTIELDNETHKLLDNLNYPLLVNDVLQVYVESSAGIAYPRVQLYISEF